MKERKILLHYIDLKIFDNFKDIIRKFLVKTFLNKKNNGSVKKNKSQKNRTTTSIYCVSKNNNNDTNNLDQIDKKIIKSLSFNFSDGDETS
jgi:hypothetical protein